MTSLQLSDKIEKEIRSKMKDGGYHKYIDTLYDWNEVKLDGIFTLDDLEIIVDTIREHKQKP